MLIAGNWKMYKGVAETAEFCTALRETDLGDVDAVVCPAYTSLSTAATTSARVLSLSWSSFRAPKVTSA